MACVAKRSSACVVEEAHYGVCHQRAWSSACVAEDEDGGCRAYGTVHGHKSLENRHVLLEVLGSRSVSVLPGKMCSAACVSPEPEKMAHVTRDEEDGVRRQGTG
jgi:hypothetical protein